MVNSLSSKHKEGEMSQCVADGEMYKSGNNYYPICKNKIRKGIIGLNLFKYSKRSKMHSLHI